MPVFNLTIPDTSPLIVYNGSWADSNHNDTDWSMYVNGTFHATQQSGASATLIFYGSAVYVFGARRVNHNLYTTTLDGASTTQDGQSNTFIFNSSLFSATNLGGHQHDLVFQNTFTSSAAPFVDVDYMVITSGDGNAQTQSTDVWLDDGAHNVTYSDGWQTSPNGFEDSYYNNTMHRTNVNGASATLLFNGNAVTAYGATSTDHGVFLVSLDGSDSPLLLNGSAPVFRPQNMLYYAGGLSDDLHNLTFTTTNGNWFDLDKFVVSTWPTLPTNVSTSQVPFPSSSNTTDVPKATASNAVDTNQSQSQRNSPGIIAACVILAAALLVLGGIGIHLFLQRRKLNSITRVHIITKKSRSVDSEEAMHEPFDTNTISESTASPVLVRFAASYLGPTGISSTSYNH